MEPWEELLEDMLATLPPGFVWPRDRDSLMAALTEPLARGFADIYEATALLPRELSPRTAVWLLPDYEEVLGPDPCLPGGFPETLEERQIAAHARWTEAAGQTLAFFLERLRAFDPGVSIQEFAPFALGVATVGYDYPALDAWFAPEGQPLASEDGRILVDATYAYAEAYPTASLVIDGDEDLFGATPAAWLAHEGASLVVDGDAMLYAARSVEAIGEVPQPRVLLTEPIAHLPPRWSLGSADIAHFLRVCLTPPAEIRWFRVGESAVGDPLCAFDRNEAAECFVRRFKPAHTEVIFDYSAPAWREPNPRRGM